MMHDADGKITHEKINSKHIRSSLKDKKRIVIKIGTSSLIHEGGRLNLRHLDLLCQSLSTLASEKKELIVVSSGAIGLGMGKLRLKEKPTEVRLKQAVAAIGQSELMRMYTKFLNDYHEIAAQILLTRENFNNELTKQNILNTFTALLEMGIIPIVNENDTVSIKEIPHNDSFGDNDMLSALVAEGLEADILILLTDTDGFYENDPNKDETAKLIPLVATISDEVIAHAGKTASIHGTGGMLSKINAAKLATTAGIDVIIANAAKAHILEDILAGKEVGTFFPGV